MILNNNSDAGILPPSTPVQITEPCTQVLFEQGLSVDVLAQELSLLDSPQVVLWYFGAYGLKEGAVEYYRERIQSNPEAKFWLYDLTAWGAFKNRKISIARESAHVQKVNAMGLERIRAVSAAQVFKRVEQWPTSMHTYFKDALSRPFLMAPSEGFEENKILLGDVFSDAYPSLEAFSKTDTAKTYSVVQYLETFPLIQEVIESNLDRKEINLVFALPNDEAKYYKDDEASFQTDLEHFLKETFGDRLQGKTVNVRFYCFQYGTETFHRPYNCPGKVLKGNKLKAEMIQGAAQ